MKSNFWILVGLFVVSCLFLVSVGCEYSKTIHVADDGYHPLNDSEDEVPPEDKTPATPTEPAGVVPSDPAPIPLPTPVPAPTPTPQPTPVLPQPPVAVAEAPQVTSVTPSGSDNLPTKMVTIAFSEPMDVASVNEAFAVVILPTNGDASTCFNDGKWEGTRVNDSGTEFTILFTQPLEGCTFAGLVSGRVKSKEGRAMGADYTWTFGTKDVTAPTVTSMTPGVSMGDFAATDTVSVTFSEPMNPDSQKLPLYIIPDSGDYRCFNGGYWQSTVWSEGNTKVAIRYTKPLGACKFRAGVEAGVTDLAGNALGGISGYQWTFVISN